MLGDRLVITKAHRKAARQITDLLLPQITEARGRYILAIGGETGSGKSEISKVVNHLLNKKGVRSLVIQEDDYFVYPPRINARMREDNIAQVGPSEVRLSLLDQNLAEILEEKTEIEKPLVIFKEDRITTETVNLDGVHVVIVEGAYTALLKNVHRHIFVDVTYMDTKEVRQRRAREEQNDLLEQILGIEHEIISPHKALADIVVTGQYDANWNHAAVV